MGDYGECVLQFQAVIDTDGLGPREEFIAELATMNEYAICDNVFHTVSMNYGPDGVSQKNLYGVLERNSTKITKSWEMQRELSGLVDPCAWCCRRRRRLVFVMAEPPPPPAKSVSSDRHTCKTFRQFNVHTKPPHPLRSLC